MDQSKLISMTTRAIYIEKMNSRKLIEMIHYYHLMRKKLKVMSQTLSMTAMMTTTVMEMEEMEMTSTMEKEMTSMMATMVMMAMMVTMVIPQLSKP